MNSNLNQLYSLVLIVLMSCGNSTGEKKTTEQPVAAIASVSEKPPPRVAEESSALATTSAASPNNNDLVGTWKLRLEVFDDNSNRIPDEEEMKKGYGNNYLLQLNADGSC
ncbi:MAG TPA: hypothetical protein VJ765_07345, partial [Chitinophagaceae bacterium]|nr:hypothetical protein [Chitinophagaceae bacterium]